MKTKKLNDDQQYQDNIAKAMKMICSASPIIRKKFVVPRVPTNLLLERQYSPTLGIDFFKVYLKMAGWGINKVDENLVKKCLQSEACRLERSRALSFLGESLFEAFPMVNIYSVFIRGLQVEIYFVLACNEMAISFLMGEWLGDKEEDLSTSYEKQGELKC